MDTHQDGFVEATHHLSGGHRVLGRRLRPFTLYHARELDFAQSVYLGHPGGITAIEVISLVRICEARPRPVQHGMSLGSRWRNWRLLRRCRGDGLLRAHARIMTYLRDYSAHILCFSTDHDATCKLPWYWYLVGVLMRHGRMSQEQAWATEVGYARCLSLAFAEAGGARVNVMSAADVRALREAGYDLEGGEIRDQRPEGGSQKSEAEGRKNFSTGEGLTEQDFTGPDGKEAGI